MRNSKNAIPSTFKQHLGAIIKVHFTTLLCKKDGRRPSGSARSVLRHMYDFHRLRFGENANRQQHSTKKA
jgi:hypothetical protein